jgi:multimeric flavodoxin WrbA
MKVLLINGSPHSEGCTYTALKEIALALDKQGIGSQIFELGTNPISGCIACGVCKREHKCAFNDSVNEFVELSAQFDGFIFGSPVYYAAANGSLISFMDRVFYSSSPKFRGKPAAAILSCRRGGATAAFDNLNKYFAITQMPIVTSQYWNMVHGNNPQEVLQDKEGMQIMRTLANNMAWLLKCIDAGKKAGIEMPEKEPRIMTNFIR